VAYTSLSLARQALVCYVRLILFLLSALAANAQTSGDSARFREAGVCSRCHVAQVLEWSTSVHQKASVACQNCHGPSAAHVANERNEIKPDRLPRAAAIAGLCQTCHAQGCPKTNRRDACESCHHPHALFNPNQNKELQSVRFAEDTRLQQFETHLRRGERFVAAADWTRARNEFEAALRLYPNHRRASSRLALIKRRLAPGLPGFETIGDRFDADTGLPLHVRVTGLSIEMVLIPRGDVDLGDDKLPASRPVHTVTLEPFYLATTELTQSVWLLIEQTNPSTHPGDKLPIHNISWADAQRWIERMNTRVAGSGFRMPNEAEWEFVARSGTHEGDLAGRAWFRENSASIAASATEFRQIDAYAPRPVATLQPDTHGIYDLAGNVWEWCSTLLKPYPYDARDGRESHDAPGLRVLRGGSFADSADYFNPAFRHAERPDRRLMYNGVRLARTVPPL
jgi:formylglycine-generating enzyme required for sulfatase activity